MHPRGKAAPAFTLIELLVVVSIIALLIAVLMPTLRRARDHAKRVVCMANLHVFGIGMQSYASESQGVLPWEGYAEGDRPVRHLGAWVDPSQWFNAAPQSAGYPSYVDMQRADREGRKRLPKDGDCLLRLPEVRAAVAGRETTLSRTAISCCGA
ncbi:MAG: type II secretion system protein [Phycisphaerales bacterium]|nr:type II secretion system protein [Phycisphaerales bacterium]